MRMHLKRERALADVCETKNRNFLDNFGVYNRFIGNSLIMVQWPIYSPSFKKPFKGVSTVPLQYTPKVFRSMCVEWIVTIPLISLE